MCCTRLAGNTGRKNDTQKIAIWAPSHNFVGLYLRKWGMYRQSEKTCLAPVSPPPHMSSQYGELRPTSGWDLLASVGHPCKFQRVSRLGSVTALVVGVSQTLWRSTEGATDIRQGSHHVGHYSYIIVWHVFAVSICYEISCLVCCYSWDLMLFQRQLVRFHPAVTFLHLLKEHITNNENKIT